MRDLLERATGAIEADEALDPPAYKVADALSTGLQLAGRSSQPIQNFLHGKWLGHPLHPALATLPIGCWTLAFALDTADTLGLSSDARAARAADVALSAGSVAAVGAAAAGMADWRQTHGRERRTGLVHALLNTTALALNVGSIERRRKGDRAGGKALTAAAWALMAAGGFLGGHLVYRRRVGVDQADRSPEPRAFRPVARLDDLAEDRPRRVEVWDEEARAAIGIALVRHRGRVHALGARCSHMGGPLADGWVLGGGIVCPWHGSRYCLRTGHVINGPSTAPQPLYEVRVADGVVAVRRVQDPGDEALTPEEVAHARARAEDDASEPPPGARKADEVLIEHHNLMRRMFEEIRRMPQEDPERRDMMRLLAGELEIHEHVEDVIFYPAVRAVSEDVPLAHAEHQTLADMLAGTLRVGTSTPQFDEHLRVLHEAVDHHASSEEKSMFLEAQRLGDRRLREIGAALERMIEDERDSRARSAFRSVKFRLLEGL